MMDDELITPPDLTVLILRYIKVVLIIVKKGYNPPVGNHHHHHQVVVFVTEDLCVVGFRFFFPPAGRKSLTIFPPASRPAGNH